MMGPEKLITIRKRVRESFKMTDAELLAWFNRQMGECQRKPQGGDMEMETLRLLRDALLQETKAEKPKRKQARAAVK
jgi:hypothetical protein